MFMIYQKHTRRQGRASGAVAPGGSPRSGKMNICDEKL